MSGFWQFTLSVLVGVGAAYYVVTRLQRRGLRWTWTLFGIPIAFFIGPIDWHVAVVLWFAAFFSIYWGYHAHHASLRMGGEEAREKEEALGPIRALWRYLAKQRAKESRQELGSFALGESRRGVCRVPIGEGSGMHGLVLGATGSGKTVTQAAIAQAYVRAGMSVVIIDPKGDDQLRFAMVEAAEETGATFKHWSPTGPTVYNPLARGGPTEIADKALAAHEWSEPHYELATQRLLGHVLSTMQAAEVWPPTLQGVVDYMNPERLDALASEVGGETAERVNAYVDGLSDRGLSDLGGGRDRLAVLAESELGRWLDPEKGGEELDLAGALQGHQVLYFHLDSDRYPAAAKLLGAALLIDLVTLSTERYGAGALLAVDEFAAIAAPQISRLFARARSAGISLLLGTQSLADLRSAKLGDTTDSLTEQVLSNVEFTVAHRIAEPDSAERLARLAGTTPGWSVTERINGHGAMVPKGEGTRTREREFVIGPDEFKRLGTGTAVVLKPKARPPAEVVRVWGPYGEGAA